MRKLYCTNLPESGLERLLSPYGNIECLKITSSYAFVCLEDERSAKAAIRGLHQKKEFGHGRNRRKLIVEWAKNECIRRHAGDEPKRSPTRTLFLFNFDPQHIGERHIVRHFNRFGKILGVSTRHDTAFVEFERQENATRALERTHRSKLGDRFINVDYTDSPSRRLPSPVYNRYDGPSRRSPSPVVRRRPVYNRYDGPYRRSSSRRRPVNHRTYNSPSYFRAGRSDHPRSPRYRGRG